MEKSFATKFLFQVNLPCDRSGKARFIDHREDCKCEILRIFHYVSHYAISLRFPFRRVPNKRTGHLLYFTTYPIERICERNNVERERKTVLRDEGVSWNSKEHSAVKILFRTALYLWKFLLKRAPNDPSRFTFHLSSAFYNTVCYQTTLEEKQSRKVKRWDLREKIYLRKFAIKPRVHRTRGISWRRSPRETEGNSLAKNIRRQDNREDYNVVAKGARSIVGNAAICSLRPGPWKRIYLY